MVLWDGERFAEVRRVRIGGRNGRSRIHALAFSPDGDMLAAAAEYEDGKSPCRVRLLDVATGQARQDLQNFPDAPPAALAFSPDGQTLIVGTADRGSQDGKKRGAVHVFEYKP